jgi:hypothetical protein
MSKLKGNFFLLLLKYGLFVLGILVLLYEIVVNHVLYSIKNIYNPIIDTPSSGKCLCLSIPNLTYGPFFKVGVLKISSEDTDTDLVVVGICCCCTALTRLSSARFSKTFFTDCGMTGGKAAGAGNSDSS